MWIIFTSTSRMKLCRMPRCGVRRVHADALASVFPVGDNVGWKGRALARAIHAPRGSGLTHNLTFERKSGLFASAVMSVNTGQC